MTRTPNHGQRDRLPDDKNHAAGISVLQRFGPSRQIHPQVRSPVVDGVYVENDGAVLLHDTPPPTMCDPAVIADRGGCHPCAPLTLPASPRPTTTHRAGRHAPRAQYLMHLELPTHTNDAHLGRRDVCLSAHAMTVMGKVGAKGYPRPPGTKTPTLTRTSPPWGLACWRSAGHRLVRRVVLVMHVWRARKP